MKRYAIFDQITGQYTFYDCLGSTMIMKNYVPEFVSTKEEITQVLAQTILNIHLKITNGLICKTIEETADGETVYYDIIGNKLPFTPLLEEPSKEITENFTKRYSIYDHTTGEQSLHSYVTLVDKGTKFAFNKENVTNILAKQMFDTHLTLSNNQLLTVEN